jgi:hypothetical protein
MKEFFVGALAMSSVVAAFLFWRFWRLNHDRLFALFAASFAAMAIHWIGLAIVDPAREGRHLIYLVRLLAFVLIILAIFDKNRRDGSRRSTAAVAPAPKGNRRGHAKTRRGRQMR